MKGKTVQYIKNLFLDKPLRICILDNCSVEFLTYIKEIIASDKIFNDYDAIFIPSWVLIEVNDSEVRKKYLIDLKEKYKKKIIYIDETDYLELMNYKEADLYYMFLYSCNCICRLVSFLKRNIVKDRPLVDIEPYEEWLRKLYENGFDQKPLLNGRIQKKNAGEISISVLSFILAYGYNSCIENITIFSEDRDTYDFITSAKNKFNKDKRFSLLIDGSIITFKSDDFIIYECLHNKYLNITEIENIINKHRQIRKIKYTTQAADGSIREYDKILSNDEFKCLLDDASLNIIF